MKIKDAQLTDVPTIYKIMMKAFDIYRYDEIPSSALDETIDTIAISMQEGELGLIGYEDGKPVGMVRYRIEKDYLYFYRLSVIPEKQGRGIAKQLLSSLEEIAAHHDKQFITCNVRVKVPKNIALYQSLGYQIYKEEFVPKPHGNKLKIASMIKQL